MQLRHVPRGRHLVSAWPVNSRVSGHLLTHCPCSPCPPVYHSCLHPLLRRASGSWTPGWVAGGQAGVRRGRGVVLGWESRGEGHRVIGCRGQGCSGQWVVLYFGGVLRPCGGSHIWEATRGAQARTDAAGRGRCAGKRVPGAMATARREPPPSGRGGRAAGNGQRAAEPGG